MTAPMTGVAPLRRIPRFHPLLIGLLVLATVGADLALTPRTARAAAAWTTTDLNLRGGPSTSDQVLLVMPAGAYVEIVEDLQNNFYRVRYGGTSGWAFADFLSRTSGGGGDGGGGGGGGATGNATVATNALNLRAGPSTSDAVLAVMPNGAGVILTGDSSNGFVSVTYNGQSGWAYESYLSSGGSGDGGGGTSGGGGGGAGPTGSAAVAVNSLNLRSDASTSSGVLAVMPNGAGVTLTGNRSNGFVSVTYNGMSGWAYESYLNIGSTGSDPDPDPGGGSDPGTTTGNATTTSALNLRSGPSTSNSVLAVMPAGASVELTGSSENGFNQVRYNGQTGWAYAQFLSTGGGTDPDPDPGDGGGSGLRGDTNGDGALSQNEIIQIIYAAADQYGQPREDMLRVANCESNLIPGAVNGPGGSYGLFQFKPGTWASTPFANDDIFDAYASANAAGCMWSVGRRNEWVCQ
jgi:uncharacterized protein YraI